jgi:hypothetical protein
MIGVIAFHVLLLLLGVSILARLVPTQAVGDVLSYLHKAIGITTPQPEQVRLVALIWLGSVTIIVDGCLLLLLLIAKLTN